MAFGATYYFKLNAVDDVGRWSGFSSTVSFVIHDLYPPAPVADLTATATGNEGEIELTWTAPDADGGLPAGASAASYQLRFSTTGVGDLADDTTAWWQQAVSTTAPTP